MLIDEIKKDLLKTSQKEKKETAVSTLRLLLSAIVNKEKEKRLKIAEENFNLSEEELIKRSVLTDEEAMAVVSSEVKKEEIVLWLLKRGKGRI